MADLQNEEAAEEKSEPHVLAILETAGTLSSSVVETLEETVSGFVEEH